MRLSQLGCSLRGYGEKCAGRRGPRAVCLARGCGPGAVEEGGAVAGAGSGGAVGVEGTPLTVWLVVVAGGASNGHPLRTAGREPS